MSYWLMKSEPDVFSIHDLQKRKTAGWDGVRNYQARNFLRSMNVGDEAFFYHSNAEPTAIVGRMTVIKEAHPDPTQFDPNSDAYDPKSKRDVPRWSQVEVQFEELFPAPQSLEALRGCQKLSGMVLLQNSRLSVQPVTPDQWRFLLDVLRGKRPLGPSGRPLLRR